MKNESPARALGALLAEELLRNPYFYLFSPDETTSNKLDAVFDVSSRAWSDLKTEPWDLPESASGHIIELLSENTLIAAMLGHLFAGGPAMMTSYEAFFNIITSQLIQHLKFLKQSEEVSWRQPIPSANLLSTSTCWRQDHNGYSHQTPALISMLLSHPGDHATCYFPVDASDMPVLFSELMRSKNAINLVTFNKTDEPVWNIHEKDENTLPPLRIFPEVSAGDSINLASHMNDRFDIIFTAAGDITTRETVRAINILRRDFPKAKFRFVNISSLSHGGIGSAKSQISQEIFNQFFKNVPPIIANFHGYPGALQQTLECYTDRKRLLVHGYEEQGSTTTPFEMLSLNHASRYDLAAEAAIILGAPEVAKKYQDIIDACHVYAKANGVDHKLVL